MASTITKTTEQKLYILKHAACDCVHMAEIKWAVDHGNAKQLKVAVDIQYDKYIREIGPNEFECVGPLDRRCGEKFTFDVGDTEPKSTKSRHKRTAKKQAKKLRKQKSRSRSQPKRVPVPVTEQPIPSTHFILPESRTLPLDVDPLEGVSPEILKLAKTAARSNDFRYTVETEVAGRNGGLAKPSAGQSRSGVSVGGRRVHQSRAGEGEGRDPGSDRRFK